ncbi:MAG: hypothetical protein EHM71_07460 [Zetaproteobacteria bacterium]|nr:MAG: hypothetical protein EHM71_07460 [Zetaproteobacteria bacterium]
MHAWTKLVVGSIFMTAWAGTSGLAWAGPMDGSRPFLCAVTAIVECAAAGECERHIAADETAPAILKVDVAGQTVTTGTARKSAIKSVTRLDGQLILQGNENGRGWSATIDEDTGGMAVAIVDNDYTFSLFGACTLP